MTERIRLLPLWLRLWHWTSAALLLTLAASGISLHFAAPGALLIPFRVAREIHIIAGLSLATTYAVFLIANATTGKTPTSLIRTMISGWRRGRASPYATPVVNACLYHARQPFRRQHWWGSRRQ